MIRPINLEQLVQFLKEQIALVTKSSPDSINENANFIKCGISSMQVILIINKIKKALNIDINPVVMFEYKNITDLATYLNQTINE